MTNIARTSKHAGGSKEVFIGSCVSNEDTESTDYQWAGDRISLGLEQAGCIQANYEFNI